LTCKSFKAHEITNLLATIVRSEDGAVEDEVEGEGKQPDTKDVKEEEELVRKVGPSPDAALSFFFTEPTKTEGNHACILQFFNAF
jgi:hypothetical protein